MQAFLEHAGTHKCLWNKQKTIGRSVYNSALKCWGVPEVGASGYFVYIK